MALEPYHKSTGVMNCPSSGKVWKGSYWAIPRTASTRTSRFVAGDMPLAKIEYPADTLIIAEADWTRSTADYGCSNSYFLCHPVPRLALHPAAAHGVARTSSSWTAMPSGIRSCSIRATPARLGEADAPTGRREVVRRRLQIAGRSREESGSGRGSRRGPRLHCWKGARLSEDGAALNGGRTRRNHRSAQGQRGLCIQ